MFSKSSYPKDVFNTLATSLIVLPIRKLFVLRYKKLLKKVHLVTCLQVFFMTKYIVLDTEVQIKQIKCSFAVTSPFEHNNRLTFRSYGTEHEELKQF